MVDSNPLNDLLIDEQELNEELLVETIGPYLQIGNESGEFYPQGPYKELDTARKVAVTLLAQKARHALGMAEEERLGPSEISNLSGVKKGTVYPKVRELENEGYAKSDDGDYWIPTAKIRQVSEYIKGDDDE